MKILKAATYHLLRLAALVLLTAAAGCIHNDLPYPRIPQEILEISVEDQTKAAEINKTNYQVTVFLPETTNPARVHFDKYVYTEGAKSSLNLLEGSYDLTQPLKVTLSLYQDYEWLITAEQDIERYFTIEGQIGASVIDVPGRRIIVRVPETLDLHHLEVTSFKLGPEGKTEYVPDMQPGAYDFTKPVEVKVTYFDHTEDWTIYVEVSRLVVSTTQVDAWAQVVWAYGSGPADVQNGFQYRRADSEQWIDVPKDWITQDGGTFQARIIHLEPLTEYVVRTVSGDNIGNEVKVTTEATMILPDGSFDQWWLDGKVWCPWDEYGTRYWDTGNKGAATLGNSNVTPTDYTPTGQGKAAKLETLFVGIGSIGKLAAGSIYTGSFKKIDGTNGILDFGRPWTVRPTRIRGYFQYHSEIINEKKEGIANMPWIENRPDSCHIYALLTDWTAPFEIRTNPNNRNLLDFSAPYVIAVASMKTDESSDHYLEFDIPFKYTSTSRRPSYILVCCAASQYGDYFVGGIGSCLYVDQLSLEYDY